MNLRVEGDPRSHPVWRDAQAALMCTHRLIKLAHETGKRVHVLHVTTKEEAVFLAGHKDVASAECTPAHLTLEAPGLLRAATLAQLNPPIRDKAHQQDFGGASRRASSTRSAPTIPRIRARKRRIPTQRRIPAWLACRHSPVMLDHVNAGRLSLLRFVDLTSAGPARLFGIAAKVASPSAMMLT